MTRSSRRAVPTFIALLCAVACAHPSPEPERFATPQSAADAIFAALDDDSSKELLDVLGHAHAAQIVTPDWGAGKADPPANRGGGPEEAGPRAPGR